MSPGHYPRALEIGAGTGYFTINLLRHGVIDQATATDISPGMLRRLGLDGRTSWGWKVATTCADAEHLPFEDRCIRPRVRPCRAAPRARSFRGDARSSGGCSRPVERWLSWASPPGTETAWRSRRSASERSPRRSGGGSWGRSPSRASFRGSRSQRRRAGSWSSWSTPTHSPRTSSPHGARRGLRGRARGRVRSWSPTATAGCCARWKRASSRERAAAVAQVRLPQLPGAPAPRLALLEPRLPASLSTTCCSRGESPLRRLTPKPAAFKAVP